MTALPKTPVTPEEYLAAERAAETKSEYIDGEVYAMSGASRQHTLIVFAIVTNLGSQLLDKPCEGFASDMRVHVGKAKAYLYPDLAIACDEPRFDGDTLLNPTLIVEILSPSTASFDKGEKFDMYRSLDSLQEYLLVAQDRCHIIHYVRQSDNTWLLSETRDMSARLDLPSINCTLPVADVYRKVTFDAT
ncbi:MAG: Uma2 family endonuclease [Anaerolineae bacterium]